MWVVFYSCEPCKIYQLNECEIIHHIFIIVLRNTTFGLYAYPSQRERCGFPTTSVKFTKGHNVKLPIVSRLTSEIKFQCSIIKCDRKYFRFFFNKIII